MSEKKFVKKLRTFGMSMKVPLTAIIIGAALIPLFLEAGIMLGTFRQSQLDARFIEIQNQCVILSNKMTRSGYMTAEKRTMPAWTARCRPCPMSITEESSLWEAISGW